VGAQSVWKKLALQLLRWAVFLAVSVAIGRRIWLEKEKLAAYNFSLDYGWLVISGLCYFIGMSACAVFWWSAMRDCRSKPNWLSLGTAYFAGHLGKYVPGKGLVVVIRATLVKGPRVTIGLAAVTCFVETSLMMATGSLIASLTLPFLQIPRKGLLAVISAGMAAGLGLLICPPVIDRLKAIAARPFPSLARSPDYRISWSTLAGGTALMTVAWLLAGLSLAGLLAAMGQMGHLASELGVSKACVLLVAVVALATVGGFVSMIPGGLGTREWILLETLGPVIGNTQAIVAAILFRLVWLFSEVLAASLFWMVYSQWKKRNLLPG
jgi:uncharacterized membrane protein YbhN (UPF0104 family)